MLSLIQLWWPIALLSLLILLLVGVILAGRLAWLQSRKGDNEEESMRLCGCATACDEHLYQIQEPPERSN